MTDQSLGALTRNIADLRGRKFDVVVIGGGIFGACAAWDAILRGLSVALIDRGDFCSGASANSYKVVHGGIRYLQHLDLARVRQSSHEKSAFIRIAPHLVRPLPIAIPTYGHGRTGKPFLRAGTLAYDLLTIDRNHRIGDPARRSPNSRSMSRDEVLGAFPGLPRDRLTGAVVMQDGQFANPTRLVFAFVASAVAQGAVASNYVEAMGVKGRGHQDLVVTAIDRMSGERFEIKARSVLNTAGPWSESIVNKSGSDGQLKPGVFSRDLCFVIPGKLHEHLGLAVQAETSDPDAILGRPHRHLFMVPWRDHTLVGVWHRVYPEGPDRIRIDAQEKQSFIDEINCAYPHLNLDISNVTKWNTGLVPFGEEQSSENDLRFGKRSRFIDHASSGGPEGLFTLIGIRFTMGRGDSAIAMKLISKYLRHESASPPTDYRPLIGGDFDRYSDLLAEVRRAFPAELPDKTINAVAQNHGSTYPRLIELGKENPSWLEPLPRTDVLGAEVVAAARSEMCMKLGDIVFRRTDLATAGDPGQNSLSTAADLAASELGWSAEKRHEELAEVTGQLLDEWAVANK